MGTEFQLAGLTFRQKDDERTLTMKPSGVCEITPEPTNKFDPLALQVHCAGVFIGYIPGDSTQEKKGLPLVQGEIHRLLAAGVEPHVVVDSYCYKDAGGWNNNDSGRLGAVTLMLTNEQAAPAKKPAPPKVKAKLPKGEVVELDSFNEAGVEVEFYPEKHVYVYNGKKLDSVTRLVSAMYPPFDAKLIAERCSKSWGMEPADIEEMWKRNGSVASGLGTAVHEAMENYSKFGERALPKMALISDIVTSFEWWRNEVVAVEALITDVKNGVCGLTDRLEKHGGRVRVCDYKVNYGCEEIKSSMKNSLFPDLPNNKVGKYCAQLSLYADMLARSGIDVDSVVTAYVFDGKWTEYSMPRIEMAVDASTRF